MIRFLGSPGCVLAWAFDTALGSTRESKVEMTLTGQGRDMLRWDFYVICNTIIIQVGFSANYVEILMMELIWGINGGRGCIWGLLFLVA